MKELVIMVGNMGAGKTTLAKKYQEKGYVVIARDSLRYAIGGGNYVYNETYEPIIFDTERYMLEDFMELGVDIVVDEVGVSKLMRKRYIELAKIYKYTANCHKLPKLTMTEAVDRRMQDPHGQEDRKVWEDVWLKFAGLYEEPTFEEGFENIIESM